MMNRFLSLLFLLLLGMNEAFQPTLGWSSSRNTALFSENDEICTGTVKWFNTMKGFGFIMPSDGSGDVFVHQTVIQSPGFRSLADGEEVEYQVEIDDNGRKRAVRVTGPGGQDVQGAPFRPSTDYDSY